MEKEIQQSPHSCSDNRRCTVYTIVDYIMQLTSNTNQIYGCNKQRSV